MIRFENVSLAYDGKAVLDNYNLELPEQGIIAFSGPSGSGKTTILRLMAGLLAPDKGQIHGLEGKKISMAFQEDRLLPWFSAFDNVAAVADDESARDWLARFEMSPNMAKYPEELSGGMQRRVALARACAFGGDVLLLDEPFKGLDEGLKAKIIAEIRHAAPLIILSTHVMEEAKALCAGIISLS